jgi:hypothetical protein
LTEEDCKLVAETGVPILAVNNSWERTPRCTFLYAGDLKWWEGYAESVPEKIQKWTSSKKAATKFGINFHPASGPFNSGMRALMWALQNGFRNIVLLGYDCSFVDGVHWHGLHDETRGLSNPDEDKARKWQIHFLDVYARAGRLGAKIINSSRHTELGCFPCMSLEDVLGLEVELAKVKTEQKAACADCFEDCDCKEPKKPVRKKSIKKKVDKEEK